MEPKEYTVETIAGEYATLVDDAGGDLFLALALLPPGTDVGTRLRCEAMCYEIVEK